MSADTRLTEADRVRWRREYEKRGPGLTVTINRLMVLLEALDAADARLADLRAENERLGAELDDTEVQAGGLSAELESAEAERDAALAVVTELKRRIEAWIRHGESVPSDVTTYDRWIVHTELRQILDQATYTEPKEG